MASQTTSHTRHTHTHHHHHYYYSREPPLHPQYFPATRSPSPQWNQSRQAPPISPTTNPRNTATHAFPDTPRDSHGSGSSRDVSSALPPADSSAQHPSTPRSTSDHGEPSDSGISISEDPFCPNQEHQRETQQHSFNIPFRTPRTMQINIRVEPASPATSVWSERESIVSETLLDSKPGKRKRTESDAKSCSTEQLFPLDPSMRVSVCDGEEEDVVLIEGFTSAISEEVGTGCEFRIDPHMFATEGDLIRDEPSLLQRDEHQFKEMQDQEFDQQDAFQEPLSRVHEPATQQAHSHPTTHDDTHHHTLFMNQEFDRMNALVAQLQSENESLKLQLVFPDSADENANFHESPMTILRAEAQQVAQELVLAVAKIREGFDKGRAEVVQGMNAVSSLEQRLEALGRTLSID
ncbi:hypothetical protein HDU98_011654 [Podochytrium sp. JEL0797]|nr:hypothetical protein HDU98_011654 [Podochytrium sp. JEL0797]